MTLQKYSGLWIVLVVVVVAWAGCTKITVVGNDLLDDEIKFVDYTDSFRLRTVVVKEDSVLTHSGTNGSQIIDHKIGVMNDPYFGRTESVVVSEMFLSGIGSDFLAYDVDSVIMTLALDTAGRYGDRTEAVRISATKNFTILDVGEDYYSNKVYSKNLVTMGESDLMVPNYVDSILINDPTDTGTVAPHIRISMGQDFINDLTSQTRATFEFTDSFAAWFKGVHLEMSEGSNSVVGVDLNNPLSAMTIYYSKSDSNFYDNYSFVFSGLFGSHVQAETFRHNYVGSIAEDFIDNEEMSDSLVFVQSFSGLNTAFEVEDLELFEDVLINQALLEFYIADLGEEDMTTYPWPSRIQTRARDDNGRLVNSTDLRLALNVQNLSLFGGTIVEDEEGYLKYVMNITAGIQDIIQGRAENKIFVSSYLKQNNPRRLVLYGPGHSEFPAKLGLTYTRTN